VLEAFNTLFNKRDYEVDEMVEVHRYLEGDSQFGKIVVTVQAAVRLANAPVDA
jgi:hypothetical protein